MYYPNRHYEGNLMVNIYFGSTWKNEAQLFESAKLRAIVALTRRADGHYESSIVAAYSSWLALEQQSFLNSPKS